MSQTACICDKDGCKDNCPQVFFQGGQQLHLIEREMKQEPRMFRLVADLNKTGEPVESPKPLFNQYMQARRITEGGGQQADSDGEDELVVDEMLRYTRQPKAKKELFSGPGERMESEWAALRGERSMVAESEMMQENRTVLKQFEPLKINGQSIVNATIGGFSMDLTKVAKKAQEVLPLPAVKLPVIFRDEMLNFYHHFFQGMELLLGRDVVEQIVSTEKYFDEDTVTLFPLISALVGSGYETDDTEITVFTKRVISSTFQHHEATKPNMDAQALMVIANFWGFEYIEPGLQLKESDLKMWLARCHDRYRIIWFNAFKSAGVPSFALQGVQDRYKSGARHVERYERAPRLVRVATAPTGPFDDELPARVRRHRHDRKKQQASFTDTIFGKR